MTTPGRRQILCPVEATVVVCQTQCEIASPGLRCWTFGRYFGRKKSVPLERQHILLKETHFSQWPNSVWRWRDTFPQQLAVSYLVPRGGRSTNCYFKNRLKSAQANGLLVFSRGKQRFQRTKVWCWTQTNLTSCWNWPLTPAASRERDSSTALELGWDYHSLIRFLDSVKWNSYFHTWRGWKGHVCKWNTVCVILKPS